MTTSSGVPAFDKTVQKSMEWLRSVCDELGTDDKQLAYQATRATLMALRDRLMVDEAVDLGAQLPMLLRGLFFENWVPHKTPVLVRNRQGFLDLVAEKFGPNRPGLDIEEAARAVMAVLERHVSEGEVQDVKDMLPGEVRELLF